MKHWFSDEIAGRCIVVGVAIAAIAVAGASFHDYFIAADALWSNAHHDRHGRLLAGQQLAIAARELDLYAFLDGIERAKVWPPLNDLILALVLGVGGIDHRLAVLPGLAAWTIMVAMTAVLAFGAITDRAIAIPAAMLASALVATSPALRLLGADVMLDVPGAAFSALSLHFFGRAVQTLETTDPDLRPWRWLGLSLTLLFFTKYNYWLLCALSLGLTAATLAVAVHEARARVKAAAMVGLKLAGHIIKRRAGWLGIAVFVLAGAILVRGPSSLEIFGQQLSLYPPNNIVTAGYAICLIGALIEIHARRGELRVALAPWVRTLARWHALPIALWMLLPDRLMNFVWFVGPTHYVETAHSGYGNLVAGAQMYWFAFVTGFHAAESIAWLAVGGLLACAALARRLTASGRAVMIFAALCLVLVVLHPQRQPRFLSTWLFSVWICAGLGLASAIAATFSRLAPRLVQPIALASAIAICAVALARPVTAQHYGAAHRLVEKRPPDLEIVRAYLKEMEPGEHHGVIASFGRASLALWPPQQDCVCRVRVDQPWTTGDMANDAAAISTFLAATTLDKVVVLHIPGYRYFPGPEVVHERSEIIDAALAAQSIFARDTTIPLAGLADVELAIWRRQSPDGAAAGSGEP